MTVRSELADALSAVVPGTWTIIPFERNVDPPSGITVMLKQSVIENAPDAPLGKYQLTYTVTIFSPAQSAENAENDLDDVVFVLLEALSGISWMSHGKATKVLVQDSYYGYDVDCTLQTKK